MEKKKIESYKDLLVWQKRIELVYEIETQLVIAVNQNYITNQNKNTLTDRIDELGKMLNTLLKNLNNYL